MGDMIELPRNPVDFKIDELSRGARVLLAQFEGRARRKITTSTARSNPMKELIAQGFVDLSIGHGPVLEHIAILPWQGQEASARLGCGIYEHNRLLYQERDDRDARLAATQEAMEQSPKWGLF